MTTTTMGELVAELFDRYERCFHDEALAARATQATLTEVLRASEWRRRAIERRHRPR
ncbi:MAG: hypothetical protein H6Q90_5774 [Deltaproteobacteria bacterium]|nr:hypothetical protein [Deltaproteobacteria bacterium]